LERRCRFPENSADQWAIEAVNGLLQLAKRLASGFRPLRYFRIMAYLKAAGLHLDLTSPVTHSK
jgi:transposase